MMLRPPISTRTSKLFPNTTLFRSDFSWDRNSTGGTARLIVILKNEPGALAAVANIFGANKANILNLQLSNREGPFHTDIIDIEVHDTAHIMRILSARSEEHTSELQSLMRISYAVFCLKQKKKHVLQRITQL